MSKALWLAAMGAYPAFHVFSGKFFKYMPDPGEEKSWYSAFYHAFGYWAMGNGEK